jgi:hypothetical protein
LELLEVVWCFFDCAIQGVVEGGVEGSEGELGYDMGEVEGCAEDRDQLGT